MGGLPTIAPPKPTDAEIIARLIEIGRNAHVPNPHTVWVVENPPVSRRFFYSDRSDVDNICYALPVGHLELYPFSRIRLENDHIVIYRYEHREDAVADAIHRLARIGRRCFFCHGVAHAATGCQYSETCLVCGPCATEFARWVQGFTGGKGIRRVKARFPDAPSFYQAAAKFMGQDHRKIPGIVQPQPTITWSEFFERINRAENDPQEAQESTPSIFSRGVGGESQVRGVLV